MNRVYLIGNGFDLSHGLKTSYNDFLIWFIENYFSDSMNNYKRGIFEPFDNQYHGINPNYVERRLFSGANFDCKTYLDFIEKGITFKVDFLKRIYEHYKEIKENSTTINWFDIEQLYYEFLTRYTKDGSYKKIELLNLFFEEIISHLKSYMFEISNNISDNASDEYIKIFSKQDYDHRLILDFNYTNTFSKKYSHCLLNDDKHIKIHGDCNSGIIFGYGDEMSKNYPDIEAIGNNEYLKHIKSFSYFKNLNYRQTKSFINGSLFTVTILGHSCGLSDRLLLNEIFEHPKCISIEIYFYQNSAGKTNYSDLAMNISRHFYNKNDFRNKIIPLDLELQIPQTNE